MSLYAVPFFVLAAHKNFAVLVVKQLGLGRGTETWDWDWGLADWDWGLGLGTGIWD